MSLPGKKQAAHIRPRGPRRKFILMAAFGAGLGLFVLLFVLIHQLPENPPVQKSPADSSTTAYPGQSDEKQAADRRERPLKKSRAQPIRPAAVRGPDRAEKDVRHVSPSPNEYQSTYGIAIQAENDASYPDDLTAGLSHTKKEIWTPEMIPEINRILRALASLGEAALPAIRQLIESGEDLRFIEVMDAADLPDYGSIRLGLFDVLRQIGGPEAEAILLGELQSTYEPSEISTLTKSLEELAPGEYRDIGVEAAREILDLALEDQLQPEDVSLLFQVLKTHGDDTVVADLEDNVEHWGYYATVALAGLPEREGIPSLIDMVRERPEMSSDDKPVQSTDIYVDKSLFALQMMAQIAIQDPEAQTALLEQTGSNRIPDSLWPKIGLALAGQYQFQNEKPENNEVLKMVFNPAAEERSYPHIIAENGQVIYIKNRYGLEKLPPEEIQARLGLIDELLLVSPSLAADRALNHSRSLVMANKVKK